LDKNGNLIEKKISAKIGESISAEKIFGNSKNQISIADFQKNHFYFFDGENFELIEIAEKMRENFEKFFDENLDEKFKIKKIGGVATIFVI